MSQENVERFHRFLDAFNRQHLAAVLALMDDDVESDSVLVAIEGGFHGHDGIRRLWEDVHNAIPDLTIEAVEVRDLGDLTVANVRLRGHGAGSDVPFDQTLWYVGRWRHGIASGGATSAARPKPSKPWSCRSKTLTPTPEPAGYCAGDVARERGACPPSR